MLFARSTWLLALGWAMETYLMEMHRSSEVPKMMSSECSSEVGDNAVWETESVDDIFEELDCFLCSGRNKRFVLNPLGELVNGDVHVLKTAWREVERPNHVQSPACETPRS